MPALTVLPGRFAICRLDPSEKIPGWAMEGLFWSVTGTGEELSLVCPEGNLPEGMISGKGWCCLRVEGPLDLGQVGVLASLTLPLREARVSIFVVSTYLTDYILLKKRDLGPAVQALSRAGHEVFSEKGEKIPNKFTKSCQEGISYGEAE
jgi:hypothetical protein